MALCLLGAPLAQTQFCSGVALSRVGRNSGVTGRFASLAWNSGSLCGVPRGVIFRERVGGAIKARDGVRLAGVRAGMLEEVANTKIPTSDGREILAFVAKPKVDGKLPVVILVHEFYGLTPEICGKADAIAREVGCIVIAPDTYRGESTKFIPKAIYLALETPQNRVDGDLDEVLAWASTLPDADISRVGLMGFCYGGGKALAYSTKYKIAKATIVVYGKPILDSDVLQNIQGPVLGIFGDKDSQFPEKMVRGFQEALDKAGVPNTISTYKNEGHAFWTNMDQIHLVDGPQRKAWIEVTSFLKDTLNVEDEHLEGATEEDAGVNLEKMSTAGRISNLNPGDGVVIVDHGSRRAQSNEMLHQFVDLYKQKTGHSIVEAAHMELAEPSISHAFDKCVEKGAKRVIICPYFFFPGRHWDRDIPALASKAAGKHAGIPYIVTAPIGLHELMVEVMTDRMEYCLSRVSGNVEECDMCKGTGRCQQLVAASSDQQVQVEANN
ncbi:hypothetical protein M758_5G168300 [Ceratodon purpureus]|nr:hypothetical protein M758_5G168300 [Ceratodon purpureus]